LAEAGRYTQTLNELYSKYLAVKYMKINGPWKIKDSVEKY